MIKQKQLTFNFISYKPIHQLVKGNVLTSTAGRTTIITDIFTHEGQKVFKTDRFGLVYENEIEVNQQMEG